MYFFSIYGLLHSFLGIKFSFARVRAEMRVIQQQFILRMIDHHPHNHTQDYVELVPKCCRICNRFARILPATYAHDFQLL